MAAGAAALGAATLGVGLLVGGIIFAFAGGNAYDKAYEVRDQMLKAEEKINKICEYLDRLVEASTPFLSTLTTVSERYSEEFLVVSRAVHRRGKKDWRKFSEDEKIATQNAVLLVGLLYKMCQVNLVNKTKRDDELNTVNQSGINEAISDAQKVLGSLS